MEEPLLLRHDVGHNEDDDLLSPPMAVCVLEALATPEAPSPSDIPALSQQSQPQWQWKSPSQPIQPMIEHEYEEEDDHDSYDCNPKSTSCYSNIGNDCLKYHEKRTPLSLPCSLSVLLRDNNSCAASTGATIVTATTTSTSQDSIQPTPNTTTSTHRNSLLLPEIIPPESVVCVNTTVGSSYGHNGNVLNFDNKNNTAFDFEFGKMFSQQEREETEDGHRSSEQHHLPSNASADLPPIHFPLEEVQHNAFFFIVSRGGSVLEQPGNRRLRRIVQNFAAAYVQTKRSERGNLKHQVFDLCSRQFEFVIQKQAFLRHFQRDDAASNLYSSSLSQAVVKLEKEPTEDASMPSCPSSSAAAARRQLSHGRIQSILHVNGGIQSLRALRETDFVRVGDTCALDVVGHLLRDAANEYRRRQRQGRGVGHVFPA